MNKSEDDLLKACAVLSYALGIVRGQLYDVSFGSFDREEAQRILNATALECLSKNVGLSDSVLNPDWDTLLTEREKRSIHGDNEEDKGGLA